MRAPFRSLCTVALLVSFVSCDTSHYEVHVEPRAKGFERSLSVWRDEDFDRVPRELPSDRARYLANLYGADEYEPGTPLVATFERAVPDDVGGAGRYVRYDTPLGSAVHYQERVGGTDDLVGRFELVREAADRLAQIATAWLTHELGTVELWSELEPFMREELEHDIANLGLWAQLDVGMCAPLTAAEREAWGDAVFAERVSKLLLFCVERAYFELDDLPVLFRAGQATFVGEEDSSTEPLQRWLARFMGLRDEDPRPDELAFLATTRSVQRSWTAFTESETFESFASSSSAGDAEDVVGELLATLFGPMFVLWADELDLSLAVREKPEWTNGEWDAEAKRVRWKVTIPREDRPPVHCYAWWTEPADAEQTARFGRTLLKGEELNQ